MTAEDRHLWQEHTKRVDERHGTLVTLITTEFERVNNHLSKLNNRTGVLEKDVASVKTRQQVRTMVFGVVGGAVASGVVMFIVFFVMHLIG